MAIDFFLITGMSVLALIIFSLIKSSVQISKKMLIVFFSNAFFFLLYFYGFLHGLKLIGALAILFGHGAGFLLGPLIFFLLKSLVLPQEKILNPLFKNLIPYLLVFIFINIPLSVSIARNYLPGFLKFYLDIELKFNLIENIYLLCYLYITFNFWQKTRKLFEENYSNLEKDNLKWYKHLINGIVVIVLADTLCTLNSLYFFEVSWYLGTIIAFFFVLLSISLGYRGIFQSRILIPDFLMEKLSEPSAILTDSSKIQLKELTRAERFSSEQIESLKYKLTELLETQKLYRDESLNLSELADRTGLSNKRLSEFLNHYLYTSFYTFINDYRLDEVKKRFQNGDVDKYTIMSIAYDAGFQSKASFYRIFKQKLGVSPTEYLKQFKT